MLYKNEYGEIDHLEFLGNVDRFDGVGSLSITLLLALHRDGVVASVKPRPGVNLYDVPFEVMEQLRHPQISTRVGLYNAPIRYRAELKAPIACGFFGWFTSKLPTGEGPTEDYVSGLNTFQELLVPSPHSMQLFQEQGVTAGLRYFPSCFDADDWPYQERSGEGPFTVVQYGTLTATKAPLLTVEAFQRAFPRNPNVRLIVATRAGVWNATHTQTGGVPRFPSDPRIRVIDQSLARVDIHRLLKQCDVGINLSRGETFGGTPCEMALTGMPVVTVHHTGMAQWYKEDCFLGVDVAGTSPSPYGGEWNEPDIEQAAEQLVWAYDHRAESLQMGKRARNHIMENFGLPTMQQNFLDYLTYIGEKYD